MRWNKGLVVGSLVASLLGAASMFRLAAPQDYVSPKAEILAPGPTGVRVNEANLVGNYFPAQTTKKSPGIILLGGSEGGLGRATLDMALALQREGFSVLQLAYFGAPGTSRTLERIPLELFDRGFEWLATQPGVDANRLALMGGSKGAEAALLVATRRPDLRAVVAGMPSSVAWNGIDWTKGGASSLASWTTEGRDVSTMPFASWDPVQGVISVYRSVEDPNQKDAAARAAIPIEQAQAATLLVCGEAETMWPACPMARNVQTRSQARGGPPVTVLAYADAGHLLFGPPIPEDASFYASLGQYGGSVEGNAAARVDSWPRVLAFLKANTQPLRNTGDTEEFEGARGQKAAD